MRREAIIRIGMPRRYAVATTFCDKRAYVFFSPTQKLFEVGEVIQSINEISTNKTIRIAVKKSRRKFDGADNVD